MKYLSIAIPCYNSQEYMDKAIESCLILKDDVEIIIVDDGSSDLTAKKGDDWAALYPDTIKCVHQENGGHGQAVNTGLKNATGLYFKVLDSDDWFDRSSLVKVIETIKKLHSKDEDVDLFIANYVYEKPSANKSSVIKYTNALPQNRTFRWYDIKHFYPQQNLLMHSVIYRTQLLRNCNLELPKHTFYVDNLFVYQPLTDPSRVPFVKYFWMNGYAITIGIALMNTDAALIALTGALPKALTSTYSFMPDARRMFLSSIGSG